MDGRFMGPGWHNGFSLFGGLVGIMFFALFIGLLVWALLRLMSHDHRLPHAPSGPWQPRDEALNAARMRYARGELSLDLNNMRGRLAEKGLKYIDSPAKD